MVQFVSINFFLGFLQFLLGFSKVPVFLCHPVFASPARMLVCSVTGLVDSREYVEIYFCVYYTVIGYPVFKSARK